MPNEGDDQEDQEVIKKKKSKSPKKHRSVLQIKLGKLALQIGYGGKIKTIILKQPI